MDSSQVFDPFLAQGITGAIAVIAFIVIWKLWVAMRDDRKNYDLQIQAERKRFDELLEKERVACSNERAKHTDDVKALMERHSSKVENMMSQHHEWGIENNKFMEALLKRLETRGKRGD